MSQNSVIIVAGGSGKRFKSNIPKQFLKLGKKPVLMHTIERFYHFDNNINIVLVLPKNQIEYWQQLCNKYNFTIKHQITEGGTERFHSVKNGLKLTKDSDYIAIHDGVRPLLDVETITRGFETAKKYGTAVPVVPVTSSVRLVEGNENKHLDRHKIKIVQTPQIFASEIIYKAYNIEYRQIFTDDASVVEFSGHKIHLFDGNIENLKITSKFDLALANLIIKEQSNNQ